MADSNSGTASQTNSSGSASATIIQPKELMAAPTISRVSVFAEQRGTFSSRESEFFSNDIEGSILHLAQYASDIESRKSGHKNLKTAKKHDQSGRARKAGL